MSHSRRKQNANSSKNKGKNVKRTKGKPSESGPEKKTEMRLQQFLAAAGFGSRRSCEELILEGRIQVDDIPVKNLGKKVNPKTQKIEMDGIRLKIQAKRYYIVNKPRGVLCTSKDPEGRTRVIDLFPKDYPRLFTVGRLDDQSEGLVLVTNDGDWAHQIAHPKFRLYRTYRVQVAGKPTPETLKQLQEGFYFTEGKFRVHRVRQTGRRGRSAFLEIVLTEGQNREVRRLLARVGHKVMALQRVAFGPVKLGSLATGRFRELHADELQTLQDVIDRNVKEAKEERKKPDYRPYRKLRGTSKRTPKPDNTPDESRRQQQSRRDAKRTQTAKRYAKRNSTKSGGAKNNRPRNTKPKK